MQGWLNHSLTHEIMLEQSAVGVWGFIRFLDSTLSVQSFLCNTNCQTRWTTVTFTFSNRSSGYFPGLNHSWLTQRSSWSCNFPRCSAGRGAQQAPGRAYCKCRNTHIATEPTDVCVYVHTLRRMCKTHTAYACRGLPDAGTMWVLLKSRGSEGLNKSSMCPK